MNERRSLLVTAPAEVRDPLRGLAPVALVRACARLRPTALLRRWLLEAEQELYDVMMRPPQAPIDGRPPAPVNPPLVDVMAEELSKPLRALADGRPYRCIAVICRRIMLRGV